MTTPHSGLGPGLGRRVAPPEIPQGALFGRNHRVGPRSDWLEAVASAHFRPLGRLSAPLAAPEPVCG